MLQPRDMIFNGDIVELRSGLRLICLADRLCSFGNLVFGGGYADLNVDYDGELKALHPLAEDDDIVEVYTIEDVYLVGLRDILEGDTSAGLSTKIRMGE